MNQSSESSSSSKINLDSLLRLKRAERPDDAFWSDFEVGMRQKQLAAIIEPKPWWLGVSLGLRRFSFPALVVTSGAAALLAFAVIRSGSPVEDAGLTVAAVSAGVPAMENIPAASLVSAALPVALDTLAEIAPVGVKEAAAVQLAGLAPIASAESGEALPEARKIESAVLVESVEVPAAFLVALEVSGREFADVSWGSERVSLQNGVFLSAASVQPSDFTFKPSLVGGLSVVAGVAEEVQMPAAVAAATGSCFERLLSSDVPKVAVNANDTLAQVRDRVLHHLGRDEDLYASVSRLGVGGDRLSLRF